MTGNTLGWVIVAFVLYLLMMIAIGAFYAKGNNNSEDYWRTCQYCFCYLVSMYVLLLIGMILSLRNIIRDQEPPVMLMICQLGFIGIVVFLMFWEASGRQMYNQMPGILLGSVLSIEYFWKNLSLKPRK